MKHSLLLTAAPVCSYVTAPCGFSTDSALGKETVDGLHIVYTNVNAIGFWLVPCSIVQKRDLYYYNVFIMCRMDKQNAPGQLHLNILVTF